MSTRESNKRTVKVYQSTINNNDVEEYKQVKKKLKTKGPSDTYRKAVRIAIKAIEHHPELLKYTS